MVKIITYSLLITFVLWVLFASLMAMKSRNEEGKLPKPLYYVGQYVLLPVGAVCDALYNWTIGTVIFLDLPREIMLTGRLKRYLHEEKYWGTWRFKTALWICKHLIEPWDPNHCGLSKLAK